MERNLKTAIIILNYNTWEMTIEMIKQLRNTVDVENDKATIVVVDNKSENESIKNLSDWIKENGQKEILLEATQNRGYAAGNNIGIRWAVQNGYTYSWVCNNDLILNDADILKKMIEILSNNSRIAAVSPRVVDYKSQREVNRNLRRLSAWEMSLGALGCAKRRRKENSEKIKQEWCVSYRPQGCCMLLRNEAMEDINYMDERTFLYCEEGILAERLLSQKWSCACALNTIIIHNHGSTVQKFIKKWETYKMHKKSRKIYYQYREFSFLQRILCNITFSVQYFMY